MRKMKKIKLLVVALLIALTLTGCASETPLQKLQSDLDLNPEIYHVSEDGTTLTVQAEEANESDVTLNDIIVELGIELSEIEVAMGKITLADMMAGSIEIDTDEYVVTVYIATMVVEFEMKAE